ncbi:MAG: sigma-54-dependent Fis family transcriptional regulator [Planctomycetes bacterium]|nr:sigma-54-dependent Fis family transcriptional regulator [Planctomycetota bacterium]
MLDSEHKNIHILTVDDDDEFRGVVARRFQRRGYDVTHTGSPSEALGMAEHKHFDVAILDIAMPEMDGIQLFERLRGIDPDTQVIMLTGQGTIETAIRAMKLGAYDYITKPCELAELEVQVERAYEKAQLTRENQNLKTAMRRSGPPTEIIGTSSGIRQVLHMIEKVTATDSSVLIQGESGTGKELVARALHQGSPRADKPLVVINCAALQETLLESELFGHEKGAFTSAIATKQGLFEVADGGTLFIDEIGEMAGGLQAKLLRVLEDGHFRRVGSTKELKTDVRIIAATNKDLAKEVGAGKFRDDLYFRLNVITIFVPPLRERPEDIPLLVNYFLSQGTRGPRSIESDALGALVAYRWPGNVRELANMIERARILADGPSITLPDLPLGVIQPSAAAVPPAAAAARSNGVNLADLERHHIQRVLETEAWNKARAARALGISRRRLYRLLEKHQISK